MKKELIASLILCFLWTFNLMAQDTTSTFNITFEIEEDTDPRTALAKVLDTMQVSMNLPEFLSASQNKYMVYAIPNTEESEVPSTRESGRYIK